ncbi:superfamily II DNA or RNA helicase [Lachnotalea glycerini]|uniref:Superfamily II DNA or RNA helicase n=1 Tax=Lachnotalea glycerini TaxID=1763509 RepID=A0A318ERN4_9FIRM|nr:DEAD/DEAH box helicase family protein [Lachnotalea glycerini]OYP41965.1 hypothetical protein CG709_04755 [Lachnotalea glycerini]PXV90235.1 superfamily II DNA or RNA helicase [Lachnotalea glycerini]
MNDNYFQITDANILSNENLREPQIEAYVEAYNHFVTNNNNTHAIIVLPTGSGKTGLIATLPYGIAEGRVLVIAPQLTILDTIEESLDSGSADNFWSKRGVIKTPNNLPVVVRYEGRTTRMEHMINANFVIANIQKLQARNEMALLNQYDPDFFDMIIIDEAHHAEARTWLENLQHFSSAKVIKITATAFRTDGKKLVGELIYKYKLSQAMSNGYVKSLEKFDYIPENPQFTIDDDGQLYSLEDVLQIKDEEWVSRSVALSDECKKRIVDESVKLLRKKRSGTRVPHKIIAAAPSINDAKKITAMYNEVGVRAIAIYNDMPNREQAFLEIDNHRVDAVVNVSMMGEGYDHKYLSIAAIFRAFRSLLPYEQFIGRILRAIPEDEIARETDNIGSVVAHELLFLNDLWNYYKEQIQESDFIKELRDIDLEDDGDYIKDKETGKLIEFGEVIESGNGSLKHEVYMDGRYLQEAERIRKERERKKKELIKLLEISDEQAEQILEQQYSDSSQYKRPDIILKQRNKLTDRNIREVIVPELLVAAELDIKGEELKSFQIFQGGRYSWIPSRIPTNGGMLATYLNTFLKNEIGRKREEWSNDDYARAAKLLDQQSEYLMNFLKGENE